MEENSLIQFVDKIIQQALQQSASDIHIEPYENHSRIRYRQDGLLYEITDIPTTVALRFNTRLKVMAKLDIGERRLPQDGHFHLLTTAKQRIDIRINTCPTLFGEKIVLRLLDANKISLTVDTLGLTPSQQTLFLAHLTKPQGLILVTGPTGSGKTVTLYSALRYLNTAEKNILTVEDPVEIAVPGINQVSINPKIGLTFAAALRTFVRQDPDIIMVGEIRDAETMEIAMQAALTGHLVLSTVHTNSAGETLTRLKTLGAATYDVKRALSLIIGQRLIRKLCFLCKEVESIEENISTYRASGCTACLQGYQGRTGIYEFLGMGVKEHLRDSALELVTRGETSLAEINRVVPT